jgi:hypothetical protein
MRKPRYMFVYLPKKSIITWLATSTRALAFSFLEKIDLLPAVTAERLCIARALNANKITCRSLQLKTKQIPLVSLCYYTKAQKVCSY